MTVIEPADLLREEPVKMTARDVERMLFNHFTGQSWAPIYEVTDRPAQPEYRVGEPYRPVTPRRIDVLLVRAARNPRRDGAIERMAVEIKVTRSDFLSDVARPEKQEPWRLLAHRHAYACPLGLVNPEEIPAGSGLIEVGRNPNSRNDLALVRFTLRAPFVERPGDLPNWMVLAFAHRLAYAEARMRGHLTRQTGDTDDPAELRAEAERLAAVNARLQSAAAKNAAAAKTWRALAAATGGLPCASCGATLVPRGVKAGSWSGWRHTDKAAGAACQAAREAQAETDARAKFDAMSTKLQQHYVDLAARYVDRSPWQWLATPTEPVPTDPTLDEMEDLSP